MSEGVLNLVVGERTLTQIREWDYAGQARLLGGIVSLGSSSRMTVGGQENRDVDAYVFSSDATYTRTAG